jgi:predicted ATP-dependent endonuclease of OLD family
MRVARVRIRNFRCLEELDLNVDDITVLVGANGTGKSSVLHALGWFFEGGHLDLEDVTGSRRSWSLPCPLPSGTSTTRTARRSAAT